MEYELYAKLHRELQRSVNATEARQYMEAERLRHGTIFAKQHQG